MLVSTVTTSLADVEAMRRAAVEMISEAWAALETDHVVPCSRYRPYIQVGRDYEGGALAGRPAFAQFSATLGKLYPDGSMRHQVNLLAGIRTISRSVLSMRASPSCRSGERRARLPATLSRQRSWSWSTTSTRESLVSRAHVVCPT